MRIPNRTSPNVPLLEDTLKFIETHQEAHDQDTWLTKLPESEWEPVDEQQIPGDGNICGTRACFAGWTVLIAGFNVGENDQFDVKHEGKALAHTLAGDIVSVDEPDAGRQIGIPISMLAAHLLGLTDNESSALFGCENNLSTIQDIVNEIKERS